MEIPKLLENSRPTACYFQWNSWKLQKLSIKGSFEALTKGIFDQGYIHSRLAILERLLNKYLTRRKNTS